MGIIQGSFGDDSEVIWASSRGHLGLFGGHLEVIWASFGRHLGTIWRSSGDHLAVKNQDREIRS